jgi:hypothetical protein
MGLGARGMGMGNAMTSVIKGDLSGYYNPALTAFQQDHAVGLSYGILSLDRSLNTFYYSQPLPPTAGVSFSVINAGVKNIDGRDADGFHTENYSTSENEFILSFALRPSRKFAFGISPKLYYYHLFDNVNSTAFGIDAGIIYRITEQLTFGASLRDAIAKYKWDTSKLYGQLGNATTEPFPVLRTFGLSYDAGDVVLAADVQTTNQHETLLRGGAEWRIVEELTIRTGIDHWNTGDSKEAAPTFGFSLHHAIDGWDPMLTYAYGIEPYALSGIHTISLSTRF